MNHQNNIVDDNDYDDSNDNNDLDESWIRDQERLQNIQKNYCREPMPNIDLFSIYINQNLYIDRIICEKQVLESHTNNVDSILKKELLLKLIQSKKLFTPNSKYKLMDILTYHVDLEPEHIQSYSKTENIAEKSSGFFKVLPILDDLVITPSIFIFHGVNAIYFLFQEVKTEKLRNTIKSILKPNTNTTLSTSSTEFSRLPTPLLRNSSGSLHNKNNSVNSNDNVQSSLKSTKKVRICIDSNASFNKPTHKISARTTRRKIQR